MAKILTGVITVFVYSISIAQGFDTREIPSYIRNEKDTLDKTIIVEMGYGHAVPTKVTGDTVSVKNAGAFIIEIVCTDFPSSFSHNTLNIERLRTAMELFPMIDIATISKVVVLRQMDGNVKEKAQQMFHGVIVHYRTVQDEALIKEDLAKLDTLLSKLGVISKDSSFITTDGGLMKSETVSAKKIPRIMEFKARNNGITRWFPGWRDSIQKSVPEIPLYCYIVVTPKEALKRKLITRKSFRNSKIEKDIISLGWKDADSLIVQQCFIEPGSGMAIGDFTNPGVPDSTVVKVFDRNRWKNMAITADVTGSMYPYTAQLLVWLRLKSLDSLTTLFTFFNDGNNKPDGLKKIGNTGGIYLKKCKSFEEVGELIKHTMQRGSGGDLPENNVEALIEAEKEFPGISFHVMIADNWAPLKDIELTKKLSKPVRIVLCGTINNMINIDYLDLARRTGGSVHLIEEDITNLALLHDGESVVIGGNEYRLIRGQFVLIPSKTERKL
jgi:hypothetical protein